MFNRTLGSLVRYKRTILIGLIILLSIAVTTRHIGSSPAGLGPAEKTAVTQSQNLHSIVRQPLNMPQHLLLFAAQKVNAHRLGLLRLSSYIYGCLFFGFFYYLARSWFGRSVGLLSALVLCLSPFFLIPARLASAGIMFFWPVVFMALYLWLDKTKRPGAILVLLALAAGLAIYTPGMIWWLIGAAILCRKKILNVTRKLPQSLVAGCLLLLVLILIPAGLAVARDWHFLESIAALPQTWPGPLRLIKNLVWMVLALGVRTPHHSPLMIARLPLLDLIQLGLLVFGVYAMWTAARAKSIALYLGVALAVVLAAINDDIRLLLIGLPAIGIFMAAGLRYLYIEWRSVFPRNPIPKSLALLLMSVLVAIQLVYGLSYSLIAWPHTSDTRAVYVLK